MHNTQTRLMEKSVIAKVYPEPKAYDIQINRAVYHKTEQLLKHY